MKSEVFRRLTLAAALGVTAIAPVAYARQADTATTPLADHSATVQAAIPVPIAGASALGITIEEEALIARGWRVSELLHADVYNSAKQKIGKVDDLIVAPDGTLSIAVIDVGGFLGIDGHRVAIPVRQLTTVAPKRLVLAGATQEELKKLPEFNYVS